MNAFYDMRWGGEERDGEVKALCVDVEMSVYRERDR